MAASAQGPVEVFVSDIHGQYDMFARILEDGAGTTGGAPVGRFHVIGDVYDRGPEPQRIMEALAACDDVDIQWGNHDIVWMGAALGQPGCIAHIVRICARYGNLSVLEDAYGIDLGPLVAFAREAYRDDPCVAYGLKGSPELAPEELETHVKVQKAMAAIQFKVEGRLADRYPEFGLAHRKLLDRIDYARGTVVLDGAEHELTDKLFPTVDPADPFALTPGEEAALESLVAAFTGCESLQRHMRVLLDKGGMYKICDGLLLLHACVPLNADGSLMEVDVFGKPCAGRALYDEVERWIRAAFDSADEAERTRGRDFLWYLWQGAGSPLFAKSKMATFELYVIEDKAQRKEVKNAFYSLMDDESVIDGILADFGMDPASGRIVCGHVPVKVKDGQDPVRCGGKVLMIDGGMSKAYQKNTGIAGFVLVRGADGALALNALEPLESPDAPVRFTPRAV